MEAAVQLVQVIAPLITVGVAVLGLRAWYWQLVAKRKFEIAEQAVTVWRRANDAISHVRDPFVLGGEGETIEIPEDAPAHKQKAMKQYRFVYERLGNVNKDFEPVRLTQILVDLHISHKAAESFDALFRVRHLTRIAAHMLIEDNDEFLSADQEQEQRKRQINYRRDLVEHRSNGIPDEGDRLSRVLDEAQDALEQECRRILRPQTFWEFLFGASGPRLPQEWSDEAKKVLMILETSVTGPLNRRLMP